MPGKMVFRPRLLLRFRLSLRPQRLLLCPLIALLFFALAAPCAWAASATTAPHSGLEGGMGRSYGPDVEERAGNKNMPQTSMPMDAYGNPISGEIPEQAAPKVRPRAGAYGGYGKTTKSTPRPLPDPPARPKWSF